MLTVKSNGTDILEQWNRHLRAMEPSLRVMETTLRAMGPTLGVLEHTLRAMEPTLQSMLRLF